MAQNTRKMLSKSVQTKNDRKQFLAACTENNLGKTPQNTQKIFFSKNDRKTFLKSAQEDDRAWKGVLKAKNCITKIKKMCKTNTTPSCGGPLRAQIFQKVCFYEQKYDFWLVRVPFALFNQTHQKTKGAPTNQKSHFSPQVTTFCS